MVIVFQAGAASRRSTDRENLIASCFARVLLLSFDVPPHRFSERSHIISLQDTSELLEYCCKLASSVVLFCVNRSCLSLSRHFIERLINNNFNLLQSQRFVHKFIKLCLVLEVWGQNQNLWCWEIFWLKEQWKSCISYCKQIHQFKEQSKRIIKAVLWSWVLEEILYINFFLSELRYTACYSLFTLIRSISFYRVTYFLRWIWMEVSLG